IGKDERGEDIERRLLGHSHQRRQSDFPWLPLDNLLDRRALDLVVFDQFPEDRGFENSQADPQANADEDDRNGKWNSPAPGRKLVSRHIAETQYCQVRQEEAARDAELRPGCDQAALSM